MAMNLNVLALNGRRQVVKVTPNTTIQKILEEVCNKQGCPESEYSLMHQNKSLDLSFTVRFSNLSNNAKLELVKRPQTSLKDSSNNKVTICFSLHSGERVTKHYNADQNLWEAIASIHEEKSEFDTLIPVCVYMRQEIVGEEHLRRTTYKSLGILEGNALIRFFYRSSDQPLIQPHFESIVLPKFIKEEPIKMFNEPPEHEEFIKDFIQPFHFPVQHFDEKMDVDPVDYSTNSERLTGEVDKKPKDVIINDNQNVENIVDVENPVLNLKEKKIIYIDDQKTILFNLNDINTKFEVVIPDDFFEITITDVIYLQADQQRKITEIVECPFQTKALREAEQLTKLKKYNNAILRIKFPDQLVLQGIFKTNNTVKDVEDFVRNFLADKHLDFYFYITPPKKVLSSSQILYEVPLVPMAVIHFGSERRERYLKDELMSKISSFSEAASSTNSMRGINIETSQDFKSDNPINKPPSSNKRSIEERDTHESKGAIPKWFNTGKKN